MKLFKWLFSTTSNSKKYFPEILLIIYLIAYTIIGITIGNLFNINNIFISIYVYLLLAQWLLFLIPCIVRIIDISDYNEKNKIKNGKKKFNFKPILYSIKDVNNWIKFSKEPDVIYVKSKNEGITTIEVSFETKGKNGPFINKKIFVDDVEIQIEELEETIFNLCTITNDCVDIIAITENNDPKYFKKIIEDLDKNS